MIICQKQTSSINPFKLKNAHHKYKFINKIQSYINFVGQVRRKYDIIYIKFKTTFDALFVKVEV
jgi:hypothetical protein